VADREDIGEVISEGVNMGATHQLYCVAVHFPATGEVRHYVKDRVATVATN
jgi:hypothetical protein